MEREEQIKMLYCENCHAVIPADSAKCPYCGALNVSGGEKQYMEKLFTLREDVEELKDVPIDAYKKEFGKSGKVIRRTLVVCCVAAILVFGAVFIFRKIQDATVPMAGTKEQMLWEKENFPKMNEMYAAGDYEGIVEFEAQNCKNGYYSTYSWEHSDFMTIYNWYTYCAYSAEQAKAKGYDDDSVQQFIMDALCMLQTREYVVYDEKEQEMVDEYQDVVREMLSSQLDMQPEDFDALYQECCKEDEYGVYFDYSLAEKKVKSYVNQNMKNGKVVR
ncbi:MAG: zinc ribbon domain-containing protein [Clostridium sp.]|nr:zinc ribbon domain-containing protein [Clostridium sp.]